MQMKKVKANRKFRHKMTAYSKEKQKRETKTKAAYLKYTKLARKKIKKHCKKMRVYVPLLDEQGRVKRCALSLFWQHLATLIEQIEKQIS